jgi:hypothetical protein
MNNQQDILIDFNEAGYKSELDSLGHIKNGFEKFIQRFNALDIGNLKNDELQKLILTAEAFLFKKIMTGKPLNSFGFEMSKEKVFEMMTKPADYFSLIADINKYNAGLDKRFKQDEKGILQGKSVAYALSLFEFDDKDCLALKKEMPISVKKRFETYATTEASKKNFILAKEICRLVNESGILNNNESVDRNISRFQKLIDCIHIKKGSENPASLNIKRIRFS